MNQPQSTTNLFIWMILLSTCNFAIAASIAPERNDFADTPYGVIHLNNDKGEEKCTLPIPETYKEFNFENSNEYCENNMVSTFWLENVPSATRINLYEDRTCSDAIGSGNFFFKLKTVKQPTDWTTPGGPTLQSVDGLRHSKQGDLLANKNTRIEAAFVGAYYENKNLNERISCVSIERSQPVN